MAAGDNVVSCSNPDATFLELLFSAIGKDASGNKYLRLKTTTAVAGSKAFTCGEPLGEEQMKNELRSLFVIDTNGDVALRVTTTT
jgi:hypothetical protein